MAMIHQNNLTLMGGVIPTQLPGAKTLLEQSTPFL